MEIDHVILVVSDLDSAAAELLETHGLASVVGGRHTGHGTGNRIVPLGTTYLELMAVFDEAEAEASPMGRFALDEASDSLTPTALCLRTDDIDAVATALGVDPVPGERRKPDGTELRWIGAGTDGVFGPDRLPFFIRWLVHPSAHPAADQAGHTVVPEGISAVGIGDPGATRQLIESVPGLSIGSGRGVNWVEVETADGVVRLG